MEKPAQNTSGAAGGSTPTAPRPF